MSIIYGPKLRQLSQKETLNSIETWKNNIMYNLSLNDSFAPYLRAGFKFGKKSKDKPTRELTDSTGDGALTKEAKCIIVDMMLTQIANWAEVIPRNDIVKNCETLDQIWQVIRLYYNLQTTGSLLNEAWNLTRQPDETPQALYSRLKQMYDDNLLKQGGLVYIDQITEDEELSPTLHSTIILHWMQILHPGLRNLVTLRFSSELRNNTYAKIFPEISRSVNDLLSELERESSVMRTFNQPNFNRSSTEFRRGRNDYARGRTDTNRGRFYPSNSPSSVYKQRNCEYCRLADRKGYRTHDISDCGFLKRDREFRSQDFRTVDCDDYRDDINNDYTDESYTGHENAYRVTEHVLNRVSSYASPVLSLYHGNETVDCILDSGATCNLIKTSKAKSMNLLVKPTRQTARMADGKTRLKVEGETDILFERNDREFHMIALVADFADTDILGGMPFMTVNDIAIRPAKNEIIIGGDEVVTYNPLSSRPRVVSRVQSFDIVSNVKQVILPGQAWSVPLPTEWQSDEYPVVIEPRYDTSNNSKVKECNMWPPPQIIETTNGTISLVNHTNEPIIVKRKEKVCKILSSCDPITELECVDNIAVETSMVKNELKKVAPYSMAVKVNPDKVLSPSTEVLFKDTLSEYDSIFNPKISRYNGHSGPCSVEVNMGSYKPPQQKGRIPLYSKHNLDELQKKFDDLEMKGVFVKPQNLGIKVEYVSPSFLVKKQSGDFRLVTDFKSISPFMKPAPSWLPDVNATLQKIASWKYLIRTDLTEAYFQIPLKRNSMKYCGVVTPYKGIRVYTTGCMGLPGTEAALEELTCLVLGDLVMLGIVAKIADDLYIGGDTETQLLDNFRLVLNRLQENSLTLSARKTVIAPRSTNMLGWTWSGGKLQANSHRISALSECERPTTVTAMKSYLGSYRFLSRVLKGYASLLEPLESTIAGRDGKSKIFWTEDLEMAFKASQEALKGNRAITLPIPEDVLWIVTDGSLKNKAVGATLYLVRNGVTKLGGFFNSKVNSCQAGWLACEIEGIAIAAALHHFAPFIRQSKHRPKVLTDSKSCVQACAKFERGEFSTSARLCTFLNAVGNYKADVGHISGKANLTADFASRRPVECHNPSCEICKFVKELSESVVAGVTVSELEQGLVRLPYTNPTAWLETQKECPSLKHVKFCLQQGSSPPRKQKRVKEVRRYLTAKVMLANSGLIVVREVEPFKSSHDRIVVPQSVVIGLLTSLHLQCCHPTAYQMKRIFNRYFFALDTDKLIGQITSSCHQCAAVKQIPHSLITQSSSIPPDSVGQSFAADIIKRAKQKNFIMRETITSYTVAEIIKNETASALNEAILKACCRFRPSEAAPATIRVDPAPAHQSLFKGGKELVKHNIILELGRTHNVNKNPVIDRAIQELIRELKIKFPQGGPLNSASLDFAIASLNSRLRSSGMSSHELWTQRDQVSGQQLCISDLEVIRAQNDRRKENHQYSEKTKARGQAALPKAAIDVGDLVYIHSEGNKLNARARYMVVSLNGNWCRLRKMNKTLYASQTYDLRLDEVYKVPGFDEIPPSFESESESDDDMVPFSGETFQIGQKPNVVVPIVGQKPNVEIPTAVTLPVCVPGSPVTGPPNRYCLRQRDNIQPPARFKE